MEILNKVQNIFNSVFETNNFTLTRETTANDVEEWDSLSHIHFIVALEKEFNITFSLGELQDLRNIGDALDLISQKTK